MYVAGRVVGSLIGLAFIALLVAAFVLWVLTVVELARTPEHQYRAAGTEKTTWVLLVVLLGIIPALIWRFGATRVRVRAAAVQPLVIPPPGWYPDPSGTGGQMWWDGTSWSRWIG